MQMFNQFRKTEKCKIIFLFLGIVILECIFFREFIGNDRLFGDAADGLLNNLLTEHWYKVMCGKEKWNELIIFYPTTNVISYTDMDLGFVFPYFIFRIIGLDIFTANKISLMFLHFMGSMCLGYILVKKCKCSLIWTYIGVFMFSGCGAYYCLLNHTQMFAISYIPIILFFVWKYFENINKKIRIAYMCGAIAIFDLLFYTAFYIGYFLAIFVMLFVIIAILVIFVGRKKDLISEIFQFIKCHIIELVGYVVYLVLLMVPFLYTYLPTMNQIGKRSWDIVIEQSPTLQTLIDFTTNTVLYGRLISKLGLPTYTTVEGDVNFSVFTLLIFIVLAIFYFNIARKKKFNQWEYVLLSCLIIDVIFSIFLVLRIGDYSIWYLFWKFFPGASALRAMIRYYMFLHLPIGIFVAIAGSRLCQRKYDYVWEVGILVLIIFANLKFFTFSLWNIQEEKDMLARVSDPPEDCEYIFVIDSESPNEKYPYAQMFAWAIADNKGKKTINGYSGNYPEDYDFLFLGSVNSIGKALVWIDKYDIQNLYLYDLRKDVWIPQDEIELTYYANSEELFSTDENTSEDSMILKPGQFQFGPYVALPTGKYVVNIEGNGLSNCSVECFNPYSDSWLYNGIIKQTDEMIQYEFELYEVGRDMEFRLVNSSNKDAELYLMNIAPVK